MSRHLTTFTGDVLYLDTTVPYALLRSLDPAVRKLFGRIETGELHAYTSVLTFDELTYRLLLALIRDRYGGSALDKLRAAEVQMISEFYPQIATALARLRTFPNSLW
jgi:predicted nucleic acid-binding protein